MSASDLKKGDWLGPFCLYGKVDNPKVRRHGLFIFGEIADATNATEAFYFSERTVRKLLTHYGGVSASEGGEVEMR